MRPIQNTIDMLGYKHFERPVGSGISNMSGEEAAKFLLSAPMVDVTDSTAEDIKAPGASYYRFNIPSRYEAFQGVKLLEDLPTEEWKNIRIVKGHHGFPELQYSGVCATPVDFGHMIVGPHEGKQIVYTWYPGELTPFIKLGRASVKLGV
jgi:hypothetical protein